jgi:uncharacterized protein (TIGR04222 family)
MMATAKCVRGSRAAAALLVLVTLLLLALLVPGAALAKEWRIDRMDVVLDVQQNSDVLVSEDITFTFVGPYTYVGRVIPTGNMDKLTDIQVFQNGQPLPEGSGPGTWQAFREGSNQVIQLNFDLADTSASWTIKYRAQGAIFFFNEGDELRWYVFDADTPVTIGAATATVKLPGSVAPEKLTAAIDTAPEVANEVNSPGPSTLAYKAGPFPAYTRFWIVAGFPKGVVDFVWTWRRVAGWIVPKAGFALPIFTLLGMLVLWRRRGRDEPAAAFAGYVSEPPSDLPPGVAGALIDERVDVKEVIATIVDLARRGYIEIENRQEGVWVFKSMKNVFRKLRPFDDLKGFEKQVAEALFAAKNEVSSDDLKDKFYTHVNGIVDNIYGEVTTRGLFVSNPKSARASWIGLGVAVLVILGGGSVILGSIFGVPGWGFLFMGSLVSGIVIIAFSRSMPKRTSAGAQEVRKWEAFRNYLRDLTRYQDMATARESFERYLPYAIAFGVERAWVRRFQEMQLPAPAWYVPVLIPGQGQTLGGPGAGGMPMGMPLGGPGDLSGGGFSLDSISDGLFGSLNNLSSVLTSAPSSSGSGHGGAFGGGGGGFGGGFSGGGGGGGFRAG